MTNPKVHGALSIGIATGICAALCSVSTDVGSYCIFIRWYCLQALIFGVIKICIRK